MSLDERLRQGLEGLDGLEGVPPEGIVDAVVGRGRRARLTRRVVAGAVALSVGLVAILLTPKALDALRSAGDPRPAVPGGPSGTITTIAGTGEPGMSGDGGPATDAGVNYPVDLGFDSEGNLYILELGNGDLHYNVRVRRVDATGRITTVAGPGAPGAAGRLVLGTTFGTTGLAVDAEGNVYLGGGDGPDINHRVIEIDRSGNVTTIAGTGERGASGDGGPATEATLNNVWDVAVDPKGNVYIAGGNKIRKVDTEGIITTIAGTGEPGFSGDGGPAVEAQIARVTGVAVGPFGDIYFIDYRNGRVRRIDRHGIITTIAGPGAAGADRCFYGEDVPATEAVLCGPEHLDVDADGNIYVADTYNNRVRVIDSQGIIRTIAGSGVEDYTRDREPPTEVSLSEPSSVAVGPDGAIYIADSGHNRVQKVVA